jgi:cell division protein FtsQ
MSTLLDPPSTEPVRSPRLTGRMKLVLAIAAAVILLAGLIWAVAFSPLFGARTVQVSGLRTLTRARVVHAAEVKHGTPLMRLDTGAVQRRVAAIPDVESVEVSTSWPNTVRIVVVERTPVAYVKRGEAAFTLIDAHGRAYRTKTIQPTTLPLLVLPTGDAVGASATYSAAATVATALPAALRTKVNSIQALTADSVTLLMDDQRVVRWGSADNNSLKARVLQSLLTQPNTQIDITNPDMPFTR